MLQSRAGSGLLSGQGWLGDIPDVWDMMCRANWPGRPENGHGMQAAPPVQGPWHGFTESDEELARKKKELDAELEIDMQRLAAERKKKLHQLDWELAEAVE